MKRNSSVLYFLYENKIITCKNKNNAAVEKFIIYYVTDCYVIGEKFIESCHLKKRKRKPKGQSRMDNPETLATFGRRHRMKTKNKT